MRDIPIPSSISTEARDFLESAPPLEPWPVTSDTIDEMREAGVKVGIPRDVSTLLAAQTVLGAARMVLELDEHPALLKDAVTTPAGCTVDGLMELEEGKLRVTLLKAVVRATERARELAPE